jgi:putative endonuclease
MTRLWFAYVVRCADGSYYAGFARDVVARVATHNAGRGARYTRSRRPVRLAWFWQTTSAERARRLEGLLKRLRRVERIRVVDDGGRPHVATLVPLLAEVSRRYHARRRDPR